MNKKSRKVAKRLIGMTFFISAVFAVMCFGSISFASGSYSVSGYIKPDVGNEIYTTADLSSGFKVEILELPDVSVETSGSYFYIKDVPESLTGYTLKIGRAGYLQRIIKNVKLAGNLQISTNENPIQLWPGDIARDGIQDNAINMCDIIRIAVLLNSTSGDGRYNSDLDYNKDQYINMIDVEIIANHFNSSPRSYGEYEIGLFPVAAVAINGKTVNVMFNKKIDMDISKDKFSVPGLIINDAYMKDDGIGRTVVLKTSMQINGTIYSVSYGGERAQFGGATTPDLEDCKIAGLWANYLPGDRTRVKVSWVPLEDANTGATAYELRYGTIDSNTLSTLSITDLSKDSVEIEGLDADKDYKFSICARNENIKSALTGYVTATEDAVKPGVLVAVSRSATEVGIIFSEEVNKEKAVDISNYSISCYREASNFVLGNLVEKLTVSKAELDPTGKVVTLTTSTQTIGLINKVIVSNVTDINGNLLDPDRNKYTFVRESYVDNIKPRLLLTKAVGNKRVEVVFSEEMNKGAAETASNYSIPGLTVLKAQLEAAGNKVTLTTTPQTAGTNYKLTVLNVTDRLGNIIDAACDEFSFDGIAAATSRPSLVSAQAMSSTTVKVIFSAAMEEASALLPSNYYLGQELGYPSRVVKDRENSNGTAWILTTKTQTVKEYTLTVSDIKDIDGNTIEPSMAEVSFTGIDEIKPVVAAALALNKNTIKIVFNEAMKRSTISADAFAFSLVSGTDNSYNKITDSDAYADSLLVSDDNKSVTVSFKYRSMSGVVYNVTVAETVQDESGNSIDTTRNSANFGGLPSENPAPRISASIAINRQTVKINFSERITLTSDLVETDFEFGGFKPFTAVINKCVLSKDKESVTLYFKDTGTDGKLVPGTVYTATLKASGRDKIKDEFGIQDFSVNDGDTRAIFAAISVEAVTKIVSITAVNSNTIDILFDQPIDEGTIKSLSGEDFIITENESGKVIPAKVSKVLFDSESGKKIQIVLQENLPAQALSTGSVYKLRIEPQKVVNLNGVAMKAEDSSGLFVVAAD